MAMLRILKRMYIKKIHNKIKRLIDLNFLNRIHIRQTKEINLMWVNIKKDFLTIIINLELILI